MSIRGGGLEGFYIGVNDKERNKNGGVHAHFSKRLSATTKQVSFGVSIT